ncbi:spermatogenesis-associated protein 6 [Prorops nasuta]|uniref:spermatogenesis-associated protein 6 n=1 Tax=Prorops nasuta TaxID=863751 RepID=UPI0034CEE891
MAGKGFRVTVQLDLHAVTCPGVWLCPNGKIALKINIFKSIKESSKITPAFPLLFHDKFTFMQLFSNVASLTELEQSLASEFVYADLIQWSEPTNQPIVLATFQTNLVDLLYPAPSFKSLVAGVDIDLLMEPSKCFPGILSPKIELSTKTAVEEVLGLWDTRKSSSYVVNPKVINSKNLTCIHRKPETSIIRQKKVCHSQGKLQDNSRICCKQSSSVQSSSANNPCSSCSSQNRTTTSADCCQSTKKETNIDEYLLQNSTKNCHSCSSHFRNTCPVCQKYKCYFFEQGDTIERNAHFCNRERHSCSPCRTCNSRISPTMNEKTDFYENLQKFYKRMYKQAKCRAKGHCI